MNIFNSIKSVSLPRFTLFISFLLCLLLALLFRWNGNGYQNKNVIIAGDGIGYYAYLPTIFIDHNLDNQEKNSNYTKTIDTKTVNKYYLGSSILISPFFAMGYGLAVVLDYDLTGYTLPFQLMVLIGGLFYLILGLFYVQGLLALFKISPIIQFIVLLSILFGTNLLYYSIYKPSMSHVYSFALISGFLFVSKKFLQHPKQYYFYSISILLGLIILVRPVNGLVILLIPALANNKKEIQKTFLFMLKKIKPLALSFILLFFILGLQSVVWYIQTEQFFVWSYSNEGFYLTKPEIINVLFSFRKGWFIYTPLAFVSLFGLSILLKKSPVSFSFTLLFLCLLIYITSSWWNWYYGDGFGIRPFVEFYALISLLLAFLLMGVKLWVRHYILVPIILFCIVLNLVQSYQMYAGILHGSNMNKEKYISVFLKTSGKYKNVFGGSLAQEPFSKFPKELVFNSLNDYEKKYPNWSYEEKNITKKALCNASTEKNNYNYNQGKEFGTGINLSYDLLQKNNNVLFVECEIKLLQLKPNSYSKVLLIVNIENKEKESLFYYGFRIQEMPKSTLCKWEKYHYSFELPKIKSVDNTISIYLWNIEKQTFIADDFGIKVYNFR